MKGALHLTTDEVLRIHKSDISLGLSAAEVNIARRVHGPNKLEGEEKVRI
jgi:hypothetical protein